MASSAIDLNVLNTLLSRLDIDNVFTEPSQLQGPSTLPTCHQISPPRRTLLQPSLSLPASEPFYQDLTSPGPADLPPLIAPSTLPPPQTRRTQSITESTSWSLATPEPEVAAKQSAMAAPTRYKTELCRPFEENGTCRYGSKCQFAHGKAELRSVVRHPKYKTDLCRTFHTTGLCPYGPRCHFIHNDEERRTGDPDQSGGVVLTTGRQIQAMQPRDELGRRLSSVPESRGGSARGLQRQYSEYQPAGRQRGVVAGAVGGGELHRRASSVADSVIRHSVTPHHRHHPQQQLLPVLDSDLPLVSTPSLGSVADSFSPASSVTDSPSPSPTSGILPASLAGAEDCVTPTADHVAALPLAVGGWPGNEDRERALLGELVARLGPHDVAALVRALQCQQPSPGSPAGSIPGQISSAIHGAELEARMTSLWAQYHPSYQHAQQQQQRSGNVCW